MSHIINGKDSDSKWQLSHNELVSDTFTIQVRYIPRLPLLASSIAPTFYFFSQKYL